MKNNIKRFLCIFTAALMLCSLPVFSFAEKTGLCGEDIEYTLDNEGNLTLTGTGETYDSGEAGFFSDVTVKTLTVGEGITAIGQNFFRGSKELTTVTLPSSFIKTSYCSFFYCPKLERVNFGDGIEIIGSSSFSDCYALKEIILPDSVRFIEAYAFKLCKGAEKLSLGNVRNIEKNAFFGCESVKELNLPDSLVHIDNYAFSGLTSLEKLSFGKNLEYIGKYAFEKAGKITEITLPSSLRTLLTMAFSSCGKLQTVSFPDYIEEFENDVFKDTPYDNIKTDGFKFAGKMITGYTGKVPENLIIPEGTLGIADYVFLNETGIKSVTLPEGILGLGRYCFRDCTNLSRINFPESLETIRAIALYNTGFYNNLPDGEIYINNILYDYKGTMPANYKLTVKEGTESVSDSAFYKQYSLEEVTLPSSLKRVNQFAFNKCTGLKKVNIPSEGLEYMYWQAFSECPALTSFTIPSTVKLIDRYVFHKSTGLKEVKFALDKFNCRVPTFIDTYSFHGCDALQSFTFPYSAEALNYYIFYKEMTDLTILNPSLVPDENKMGICKRTVITGFKGSEAEKFAKEFGCAFKDIEENHTHSYGEYKTVKAPTAAEDGLMESRCTCGKVQTKVIKLGDVDRDEKITASDARTVLRASVNLETLTDAKKALADFDGDKKITASDARLILRKSVGLN